MTIEIKGVKATQDLLAKVKDFLNSEKPMAGLVEELKEQVIDKTGRYQDYEGKRFIEYSEAYAKKKKVSTKAVDMRQKNIMMENIAAKVMKPNHGRVFVKNVEGRGILSYLHNKGKAKGGNIREFMNVTKNQLKQLQKKHFDDPIKKILGRA